MSKKILVIDDDAMNLRMAEFMLKQQDYTILTADTGKSGLSILKQQSVDLILLDIEMPEYNGFQVLSDITADPTISGIPVVMLTASSDEDDITKSTALGAVDYISKPFKPQNLIDIVNSVIKVP